MAKQGTISGSGSNKTSVKAVWSVSKQSIEDNATSCSTTYTLTLPATPYALTVSGTMAAGGVSKTFNVSIAANTTTVNLGSITAYVSHNTDGTGGARITCSYSISSGLGSGSCNGWATFDTIARQATLLTAPNFNDEENPTIVYQNPAGESVSSLYAAISFDGTNPDIAYREVSKTGTTYTFNLTEEERRILRTNVDGSNSIQLYFYLRTVIGDKYYFSYKQATFTIVNGMPEIEATITDTNAATVALTGNNKVLVKYFSNAWAYMNMIGYKEAYFTAYYIEHNGVRKDTTYSHTFNAVETNTFNFYIADNRNNGVAQSVDARMIDYVKLTCNYHAVKMPTSGKMAVECSGNYFNDTFGAAANTLTVEYRYKPQGGEYSSWRSMTATKSGNTYNAAAEITGLDYRQTYVFQCRAVDKLMTVSSTETVIQSFPIFHWGKDDFTFEVPVNFNAGATGIGGISGDDDITINSGKKLYLGDDNFTYLEADTENNLTIKAVDINLQGYLNLNGYSIESGIWQPLLSNETAVSSYTNCLGWYQKVGNVVSIGWLIKANIKSGYSSSTVSIKGNPFTPISAAFGGGIAHNVAFVAGHNFEGYGIDTAGLITLRGQPCNNTTLTNLNITSSAYYPTGSTEQVMTLSGTICYFTAD